MDTNYVTTYGIGFLEFTGRRPHLLRDLFQQMELQEHKSRLREGVTLHTAGNIHFISNPSSGGSAERFRDVHERGASAIGLLVENSAQALEQVMRLGAEPVQTRDYDIPAIKGVGNSLIYLVDADHQADLFSEFGFFGSSIDNVNQLVRIDHLTHNLREGGIEKFKQFYGKLFGFKSVRSFDIEGKKTGLYSEVISSPCGRVVIPLNETKDDKSQIAEFIRDYNGEGIQHIALHSANLYETVANLSHNGIEFQDTPDTYYDMLNDRLPDHGEEVEKLRNSRILIDGGERQGGGFLLQIFTKNSIGPIFFEYIQRKGNEGFGEGNFQALFESIELDQEQRGVI
ncbi:4-hydroxyphenylpyruvate dioxygenase [Marinimicrobium sp. ABcell2]|uniref:4-hydroxyphenylpyruvate dioxygenase n=1 Tax=Marinimicrobium sp. ABcell2 TaxID=3069751 RepID=UPI0027B6B3C9|nr:4-hydroxyphenylpyruvate dioxygenase [Marinimicrobium sp. ABcell2]MDQ2076214.1 4-hydroxyphenylpyruvate dioxygenase [Marinimicrobium sp. ABcell2]